MKLSFPADALWQQVQKMGAVKAEYTLDSVLKDPPPPIVTTPEGLDVPLDEVTTPGGLLGYDGAQVVLYIPDHGKKIDTVLAQGDKGNRVHIANCQTLDDMRRKKRFQRYRAVVNITGDFEVFGFSMSRNRDVEGKARLQVCINCLKHLNYKGYLTESSRKREIIINSFSLKEFFAENSTLFRYLPTAFTERKSGYTDDWKNVSQSYRTRQNFTCESCRVDLNQHKYLLHTHHSDGNKRNNHSSNLIALCADCHRKQPLHDHMFIKASDMALLQKLRQQQGLLNSNSDWEDIFQLIDPPYEGLVRLYRKNNVMKPEVGYEITDDQGQVIAEVELAWPDDKFAITKSEDQKMVLAKIDWTAQTLQEALYSH
ncbi:hypothetical protein SAMN05421831_10657 [Allopseudospirillum japonicum]|uniref:HNH nuclease domain-containing protein n=1 Tax=Allopseudospirillum japonicum TaxID=64971 RepID=A0A1H6SKX0_9GAMM|nr:HNH endonuclease [Allopseudospirillum japonicum]SEI64182.1 hypothetical protein SAMN05421831_10657 [Allopseudospirillum japonicum]